MPQDNAARADEGDAERQRSGNKPVAKFKHGGLEVAVFANHGENGTMYNSKITNSYKDDKTGEWKETTSLSPTDLLVVGELSRQAFAEIAKLKQPGRAR